MIVDASVNGALLSKFYNETYEILEMIANKNHQWLSTKQATTRVTSGVHNVGALIALSAQVTSLINMVKAMTNTLVFIAEKDIYLIIVLEILP